MMFYALRLKWAGWTGIGSTHYEYSGLVLVWAHLILGMRCLKEGLAIKNKPLAVKLFGGVSAVFAWTIHGVLSSISWNQGGWFWGGMLGVMWVAMMVMLCSKGLALAYARRSEAMSDPQGQWNKRSMDQVAKNERRALCSVVAAPASAPGATPRAYRRRL